MTCRTSTRNPVQVRAVQFYSSLVDTNGCGHIWRDRGRVRVRPATVIGLRPAADQLRPENSAGWAASANMCRIECHALLAMIPGPRLPVLEDSLYLVLEPCTGTYLPVVRSLIVPQYHSGVRICPLCKYCSTRDSKIQE